MEALLLVGILIVSIKMYVWGVRYNAFGRAHRPGLLENDLSVLILLFGSVLLMIIGLYIAWNSFGLLFSLLLFVCLVILVMQINYKLSYRGKAEMLVSIYAIKRRSADKLDLVADEDGYIKFWSEVAMTYRKEIGIGDGPGFIPHFIHDEHEKFLSEEGDKLMGDYDLLELIFRDELDGIRFEEKMSLWKVMDYELGEAIKKYLKRDDL